MGEMIKTEKTSCTKSKDHDFLEIYSFQMGTMFSIDRFWKIFKCSRCMKLKLVTKDLK